MLLFLVDMRELYDCLVSVSTELYKVIFVIAKRRTKMNLFGKNQGRKLDYENNLRSNHKVPMLLQS